MELEENNMNTQQIIAICIFAVVMILIISEKIDRTVVALSGAALMFLFKIVTFEEGISHIDFNTLFVLIGMMIVVAIVKKSGLFEYVAILTAKISKGDPSKIMVYFMIITAVLSAILDNVTTVLLIGPMTLVISDILSINPIPFLMTQIIASNVGGTSTLIGDPPNIMIGSAAGLSFGDFVVNLGPVIVIILILLIFIFKFIYRKELVKSPESEQSIAKLDENNYVVSNITKKERNRASKPPFITSTLQQEASSKLNFKAKRTMMIAQKLYEGIDIGEETVGLITYMRTDSIRLSDAFIGEAKPYIEEKYGKDYVGSVKVSKKTENVQDAHEGIRPTSVMRTPESLKEYLKPEEYKLYALIYARAVASLMAPAKLNSTTLSLDNNGYEFKASGSVIQFDGYLRVYGAYEKQSDEILPVVTVEEKLLSKDIQKSQHFTKPPARYTEAKLIKELEELGIGRPSTYASIIDTIVTRRYVDTVDKAFKPTDSGLLTNEKLVQFFESIINVEYTAQMEKELDEMLK